MKRMIFFALCATLFLLPLPFGAVEEWSIFAFEAVVFFLFGLSMIEELRRTLRPASPKGAAHSILSILIAIFFIFTTFQLIPLPASLVHTLSPQTYEINQRSLAVLDPSSKSGSSPTSTSRLTLSLSPALTKAELLKYLAYLLFGVLLVRHIQTRRDIEILIWTLIAAAVFQSLYGLAEFFGATGRIFGWKNKYDQGSAFGTFVNRNHFSGYLEMIFPLALGYFLARTHFFALPHRLSLREKIVWFGEERRQKTLILGLFPFFIALGIVFSRCRMGILIFLVTLFLMSFLASAPRSFSSASLTSFRSLHSANFIRRFFVIVALITALVGLQPIISRFTDESIDLSEGRLVYFVDTLRLIGDFPLSGTGPATFVHAYLLVSQIDNTRLIDHAHNDYLEILSESGLIAGGAIILAALGALIVLFIRWAHRRDHFIRGVVLGILMAIVALLIHSLMDFNLRIPANMATFIALYALAFKTVGLKISDRSLGSSSL
jgi:O-antigen ligase